MELPEIDTDELAERLAAGGHVLDVRTPDEYARAHVPGAVLIPLPEVAERVDEIPTDGPVFVVCAVGSRSARATQLLRSLGIDATNVAGGTKAWLEAGRPHRQGPTP